MVGVLWFDVVGMVWRGGVFGVVIWWDGMWFGVVGEFWLVRFIEVDVVWLV